MRAIKTALMVAVSLYAFGWALVLTIKGIAWTAYWINTTFMDNAVYVWAALFCLGLGAWCGLVEWLDANGIGTPTGGGYD